MVSKEYIRWNRIMAGVSLVVSFIIYYATMARTVSFWDCGEFVAVSHTLGVPHPPGSPLYLLLGRIFSMVPFNPDVAYRINVTSVLFSAIAVMLLYLIVVKVITHWRGEVRNTSDAITAFGAAMIGALTFAFSDSHWFNAVEAEVYALSTFFTAIVVWLVLHWSERADKAGNERYILIIAYMIGLATGLHLLNLLALPFIALIIYFRKQEFDWKSFIVTVAITGITFLIIHNGIIKGLPRIAGSFGLISIAVIIGAVVVGTVWAIQNRHRISSLALTSVILILVGYSTYSLIFIRSNQNPGIDENDPETVEGAISYLEREQYGAFFFLPRRYKTLPSKQEVVGMPQDGRNFSSTQDRNYMLYDLPEQWKYFWNYQVYKMYWRYFLWQYAGRGPSTDPGVTAFGANSSEDGVDWFQFGLPLALILGLAGMFHHFARDRKEAFSFLTLFFMAGLAIILYINQDNPQPRERDYSYVGSFFVFAVWIGVGAAAISERIQEYFKEKELGPRLSIAAMVVLLLLIPGVMLTASYESHSRAGNTVAWDYSYNLLQSCEPNGIIFTNGDNDTFPLWYLQEVENLRKDVSIVNLSLLNTPWYIKQMRDRRPPNLRFVNMTDNAIDNLAVRGWKSQKIKIPVNNDPINKDGFIEWTVKPTYMNAAIKVQDLMIIRIINDNAWRSPIYFAVTVSPSNRIGLDKYLEMEGLTFRLISHKADNVNIKSMEKNLMTDIDDFSRDYQAGYQYRNLDNPDVYYNPNIVKLLQNYRSAFMQLAVAKYFEYIDMSGANADSLQKEVLRGEVLKVLNRMDEKIPISTIPMTSKELYFQYSRLFGAIGENERMRAIIDDLFLRPGLTIKDKADYAATYLELGEFERGKEVFEELYQLDSKNPKVVGMLLQVYRQMELYSEAEGVLLTWLDGAPQDNQARKMLEEIQKQKAAAVIE